MAFDAGSAVGKIVLDSKDWTGGMQNVTKSMFTAQVAFAAFQKILNTVTKVIGDATKAFLVQEKAEAQLNATLKSTQYAAGLTAKEIKNMASGFQEVTNFGDEAVISAQNLLLTFTNIGKDIFPQTTEMILDMSEALGQDLKSSAIQLGKALQDPILGVTALRRVGVNFNEAQTEVIKNLVKTGRQAEAQALILKELQTEFGGSARAARDTFGGALKSLENNTGDVYESIGKMVAIVGRDLVESFSDGVKAVNDFLSSEEGFYIISDIIANISAGFEVTKKIFQDFADVIQKSLNKEVEKISGSLQKLFGDTKGSTIAFQALATVVKVISAGFSIAATIVGNFIKTIIDLVDIVKESIGILTSFGTAIADPLNPEKWDAVGKQIEKTGNSIGSFASNIVSGNIDLITTTINEFDKFGKEIEVDAKKFEETWTTASNNVKTKLIENRKTEQENAQKLVQKTTNVLNENLDEQIELEKKAIEERKRLLEEFAKISSKISDDDYAGRTKQVDDLTAKYKEAGVAAVEADKWAAGEKDKIREEQEQKELESIKRIYDNTTSFVRDSISQLQDIVGMYYNNKITEEDNDYENQKKNIEANITDEEQKRQALDKLEEQHKKKVSELKKKQWEANKAFSIGTAIIDTANAVVKTLSAYPWPWNVIPAAVVAGLGAAQIAMIASQPMPAFQEGGIASPGLALVGEAGPEIVNIGSTSRIIPNDETSRMLGNGGININVNFSGPVNSQIDIDRAMTMAGNKLRNSLRGA